MVAYRTERDSMGELQVPVEAYYGAQTRRAELNFQISPLRFPRPMIRALGLIKLAAAQVNQDLGLLDPSLAQAIREAAAAVAEGQHDDQFVLDVFQTGSGTSSNMNANEVIAGIANEAATGIRGGRTPVHPNDHVNMGQSSNDVIPTAIHLAALESIQTQLLPALQGLEERLTERAVGFDSIVKIGRTHLQDAVPIRLGQEFSGYAAQAHQSIRRIRLAGESLTELPIGGTAVGTGINTHVEFPKRMAEALTNLTGLPFRPAANTFEAMAGRDAAVEASAALRSTAISLSNIANNIRWLGSGPRCGLGEIRIPALQPGSSIMPGKVNPVIPEAVMMVAAQVVGNDATIAWSNALGSQFELNVMMPVIGANLLESIQLLSGAATHLDEKCVAGLEADVEACTRSIEKSLAMCTALVPRIGYDNAARLAKLAFETDRTVREVAVELSLSQPEAVDHLDRAEIERLLDPFAQTVRGSGVGTGSAG